jgi:GNAT superfamily N-acetyltransferase
LNNLIEYGKKKKFSKIIGPVNIPAIIYGWGFMEKGSEASIFIGKPINPPIYQEEFFHKGFTLKTKELSLEGPVIKLDSKFIESFTPENYELFHPKSWEEVLSFKPKFYRLKSNLHQDSVISPGTQHLYETYVEFVKTYGGLFQIIFLKYKITGDIVGCFFSIPNPFRKNEGDIYDSCEAFLILLDKEHQGKGLGWLLSLFTAKEGWDNNIRYTSSPIEKNVKRSIRITKRYGLEHKRTHLILEYSI